MSELWHICILHLGREGGGRRLYNVQAVIDWIELDLGIHLWRMRKIEVIRAGRREREVRRGILAQLGPVGRSVQVLALYLFICIQVTAYKYSPA